MTGETMLFDIVTGTLTATEADRLTELETRIERGIQTFVDVGLALMEIRDGKLYRDTHGTFEDYCRDRWGWERRRAYQLMAAAQVVENVHLSSQTAPANELQARPLTSLPPEAQPIVWQMAVESAPDGKVTAKHVEETVRAWVVAPEPEKPHVAHNSGNNEWYTPAEYIYAAREVMGGIDLDPASSDDANTVVMAEKYYTAQTDGLSQDWSGRVWMNPPYASDLVGRFIERLASSIEAGAVTEAVVLVNNATETAWFNRLISVATAVCFPRGRVRFWQPGGELGAPLQGQAVVYCGPNTHRFIGEFKHIGWTALATNAE